MFVLWQVLADRKKQNLLILIAILSSVLYSILSLFGPDGFNWLPIYQGGPFTFGNSTFAGMYLFGAFLLSIYNVFQTEKRKWWMYLLPILIIISPNTLNSAIWLGDFSRGFVGEARASTYVLLLSVIGLLVILGISKISETKTKTTTSYALFGLGLIVMSFAIYSLLLPGGYVNSFYLEQATAVRPLTWEIARKAIIERPLFGWGSDNFERVFEANYDNRILQDEYGNEAWLDRAHNVVMDQLVDAGFVGFVAYIAVYLTIIVTMIYTALKTTNRKDKILASILAIYFPLHFIELQTAFDTSISFPLLAFFTILAVVLFDRIKKEKGKETEFVVDGAPKYIFAGLILILVTLSFVWGFYPFVRAQIANAEIRLVGSAEERISWYPALLSSQTDPHAFLWRTATDFQRGIADNPKVLEKAGWREILKKEIGILENGYREYITNNPNHFRAHLNLADLLIYQSLFQVDKLAEAQEILDQAIKLVPQSPQPYWMKAVAYVYMGKFTYAREAAQAGLKLNPKIKQSQDIVNYVERSNKTFPEIDLFFFRQI